MTGRATDCRDLIGRLRRDGFLYRGIDLPHHPHHCPGHVLGRLRVAGEVIHRIARTVEDVAVHARHTERGRECLHGLEHLRACGVFREHLKVCHRRLRRSAATTLWWRTLRRLRGHDRPRQDQRSGGNPP